jgi:hypothetical protein
LPSEVRERMVLGTPPCFPHYTMSPSRIAKEQLNRKKRSRWGVKGSAQTPGAWHFWDASPKGKQGSLVPSPFPLHLRPDFFPSGFVISVHCQTLSIICDFILDRRLISSVSGDQPNSFLINFIPQGAGAWLSQTGLPSLASGPDFLAEPEVPSTGTPPPLQQC